MAPRPHKMTYADLQSEIDRLKIKIYEIPQNDNHSFTRDQSRALMRLAEIRDYLKLLVDEN